MQHRYLCRSFLCKPWSHRISNPLHATAEIGLNHGYDSFQSYSNYWREITWLNIQSVLRIGCQLNCIECYSVKHVLQDPFNNCTKPSRCSVKYIQNVYSVDLNKFSYRCLSKYAKKFSLRSKKNFHQNIIWRLFPIWILYDRICFHYTPKPKILHFVT